MRPGILPEHGFKHKGNHYASLPWFGTKIAQKYNKGIKVLRFSSRRETPRSHVLYFRATSDHNVLYMRSVVSKEMSRFRLPSSGRRRLLLKVPIAAIMTVWSKSSGLLSQWQGCYLCFFALNLKNCVVPSENLPSLIKHVCRRVGKDSHWSLGLDCAISWDPCTEWWRNRIIVSIYNNNSSR